MVTNAERLPADRRGMRVAFTRGSGCAQLAALLAEDEPVRVVDDLAGACVRAQADVLVSRKLVAFDLTNQAVPHEFDQDAPRGVAALVGTGPHSLLAGMVASRVGVALDLPVSLVTAHSGGASRLAAARALGEVSRAVDVPGRLIEASNVQDLIGEVGEGTLLVFGAAGGPLLQRLFFGPGVRLRAKAPSGAVIVRAAPLRVFRAMSEPLYVGSHLSVGEALRLIEVPAVAVAEDGVLVGLVSRSSLNAADPSSAVKDVMTHPVSVNPEDPVEAITPLIIDGRAAPTPVTDESGVLVGSVAI